MSTQMSLGYWLGYEPNGNTLADVPKNIDVVALAFGLTAPNNTLSMHFLTQAHSEAEIREGVKVLQARGQKVIMSINGDPNLKGHEFGWQGLDPVAFAASVRKTVIDDWGLDGIDLDNEAEYTPDATPDGNFIQVIKHIRAAIGPTPLITTCAYMGQSRDMYLNFVMNELNAVYTMAYWNRYDDQIRLMQEYAALVGPAKIGMGVAMEGAANPGQQSSLDDVPRLAAVPGKAGMMLWHLNSPLAQTWCDAIAGSMP